VSAPVFFGSYTGVVKNYCERQFLQMVAQLPRELLAGSLLIDNSKGENDQSDGYCRHLQELAAELQAEVVVMHLDVDREPPTGRLHRRIAESANLLRERMLASPAEWLLPWFVWKIAIQFASLKRYGLDPLAAIAAPLNRSSQIIAGGCGWRKVGRSEALWMFVRGGSRVTRRSYVCRAMFDSLAVKVLFTL